MPTNAPTQTALLQLDKSSPKFADQLRDILRRRDFGEQISSLQTTTDLMEVIDYLDKVPSLYKLWLSSADPTTGARCAGSH